jgi:hypothetical protein
MAPAQAAAVLQHLRDHPDRVPLYSLLGAIWPDIVGRQPQAPQLLLGLSRGLAAVLQLQDTLGGGSPGQRQVPSYVELPPGFSLDAMLHATVSALGLVHWAAGTAMGPAASAGEAAEAVIQVHEAWHAQGAAGHLRRASRLGCGAAMSALASMARAVGSEQLGRLYLDCLLGDGHLLLATSALQSAADALGRIQPGDPLRRLLNGSRDAGEASVQMQAMVLAGGWRRVELLASALGPQIRRLAGFLGDQRLELSGGSPLDSAGDMAWSIIRRLPALAADLAGTGPDWTLQPEWSGHATQRELGAAANDLFEQATAVKTKDVLRMLGRECAQCSTPALEAEHRLQRCGGCQRVSYCGVECQRAHWSRHKQECKAVQAQRQGAQGAAARK